MSPPRTDNIFLSSKKRLCSKTCGIDMDSVHFCRQCTQEEKLKGNFCGIPPWSEFIELKSLVRKMAESWGSKIPPKREFMKPKYSMINERNQQQQQQLQQLQQQQRTQLLDLRSAGKKGVSRTLLNSHLRTERFCSSVGSKKSINGEHERKAS